MHIYEYWIDRYALIGEHEINMIVVIIDITHSFYGCMDAI